MTKQVLWWGHYDADYSRNRILRAIFNRLDWQVYDFQPKISPLADWEAAVTRLPSADLIWVPCFRQRDLAAALALALGPHLGEEPRVADGAGLRARALHARCLCRDADTRRERQRAGRDRAGRTARSAQRLARLGGRVGRVRRVRHR